MAGKLRPVRIYSVAPNSKRLITVFHATSLRGALEEYAKRKQLRDPVFVGNTVSGFIGDSRIQSNYEAQEAK